jgi:peroxin-19
MVRSNASSALLSTLTFRCCPDVLDQFSSVPNQTKSQPNAQPKQPTPPASGPGRPSSSNNTPTAAIPTTAPQPAESEEDFMARLASEMSSALGNLNPDPSASNASADNISKMGKELEDFTSDMEKQGVHPEDLLKVILGDVAETGGQAADIGTGASHPPSSSQKPMRLDSSSGEKESFEETIRRTMERMQASDSNATNAATEPGEGTDGEEDMLANLLKTMESGDANSEDSLSKVFLGMMEQLTNKDMLYEPMKELDTKYPDWLANNEGTLPVEDYRRYEGQRGVVREIVTKFEEQGYNDDDSRCREYIWERMQKMQGLGSPPEDLIANPFPGGMMGGPGAGGAGEGGPGKDVGCPPQ